MTRPRPRSSARWSVGVDRVEEVAPDAVEVRGRGAAEPVEARAGERRLRAARVRRAGRCARPCPSATSRSTRRVMPLRESSTRSARTLIRSRRPGAAASWSSASYSASDRPCAARSSSSSRRVSRACAWRNARHDAEARVGGGRVADGVGGQIAWASAGILPRAEIVDNTTDRARATHRTTAATHREVPMPEFDVDALRARFPALADRAGRPAGRAVRRPRRDPGPGHGDRGRSAATTASRTRTTTAPFLTSRAQRRDPRRRARGAGRPAQRGRPVGDQVRREHDDADDARRALDHRDARARRRDRRHEPRPRGERRPVARRRRGSRAHGPDGRHPRRTT